ncbi:hypothetical protein GQ53DRAFT_679020 [Thozetella sp. PMI_491]|nr:hypothetical protein GQ53DRAFT_679020 [Thozetella sp. PMI_491]
MPGARRNSKTEEFRHLVTKVWSGTYETFKLTKVLVGAIWKRDKSLGSPLVFWLFTTIFGVIYSLGVYRVLLQGKPQIGILTLTASETNYIVALLSQIFSLVTDFTARCILNSLRWELATRKQGVSFLSFFQLSAATNFHTLAFFTIAGRFRSLWGVLRMLLPILSVFFGSILKFQAKFQYYFIAERKDTPVYAGLMPIDTRVLGVVPTSILCLYFAGWIPSLLGMPKYATSMPVDGCSENCSSFFLPGGLEIARKVRPIVNATILEGKVFEKVEAIRTNCAPGLLLRFDRLGDEFHFDTEKDCSYYGDAINDTIQICISEVGPSVAVGWQACPTTLHNKGLCNDTKWRADMTNKVLLTVHRQSATAAYNRRDLTIQDVELTSIAAIEPVYKSLFQPIWDKIFVPPPEGPSTAETDQVEVRALLFSLSFLLRLYDDVFPDDPFTPLRYLQNFLAIPLQFNTVCIQYANYTVGVGNAFAMSPDMFTTATGGRVSDRLVSLPWTAYTFLGASAGVVLLMGVALAWMLHQPNKIPDFAGVPEVDILAVASTDDEQMLKDGNMKSLMEISQGFGNDVRRSTWKMARKYKETRLHLSSP